MTGCRGWLIRFGLCWALCLAWVLGGTSAWARPGDAWQPVAESFSFAVMGDTPYTPLERRLLPSLLDYIAMWQAQFIVHVGDIKNGASFCNDGTYQDIYKVFQASKVPLIYVPGDNEWTDCHRLLDGAYDPVERLHYLRKVFFADNQTLGRKHFTLERQSESEPRFAEYVENVRWSRGRVLFVGLNLPGSQNNYGPGPQPSAEFLARSKANTAWLNASFALARQKRFPAIFVLIQADPEIEAFNGNQREPGFFDFMRQLTELTLSFPGQVVLVHGDSHYSRIDKPLLNPLTGKRLANFTRVEVHGSPIMGWTRINVMDFGPMPMIDYEPRVFPGK